MNLLSSFHSTGMSEYLQLHIQGKSLYKEIPPSSNVRAMLFASYYLQKIHAAHHNVYKCFLLINILH